MSFAAINIFKYVSSGLAH